MFYRKGNWNAFGLSDDKSYRKGNIMKKRTITIIAEFDMTGFSENEITSKEKVKEMVEKESVELFGWDEGYERIHVDVTDV